MCVRTALRGAGVDLAAPTLLLSECVLVYLEPQESCAIIAWAAQAFAASVFVTYEQVSAGCVCCALCVCVYVVYAVCLCM